ncbi:MAG TPA: ATP-binding protein [Bacillota bacterium]|nr:ATP-binding protein [Bacillota bacterium]
MTDIQDMANGVHLEYFIEGLDFLSNGEASSNIKHILQLVGYPPAVIRRAAIAAYEAEMNIAIHASQGKLMAVIRPESIEIIAEDSGPGIPDIELAMQVGWSTAPAHIREMGFGAGMGLPNIKRCADEFDIESSVGQGTRLRVLIFNK